MEFPDIQSWLLELLRGATVLSMRIAGPELELFFCGVKLSDSRIASIDTDAWIFVGNKDDFEPNQVTDAEFFAKRPDAIVGLYELTGYDVEAVEVSDTGVLILRIGEKDVIIHPVFVEPSPAQDFWTIILEEANGRTGVVGFEAGNGFFVRGIHGREPKQLRP